ncbi:MAG: DJ-1 family glyoxalase III [Aeromonas sp.]
MANQLLSAWVLVAPGSEELETVAAVDVLARAGVAVQLISCCPRGARQIVASRGVTLVADAHISEQPLPVLDLVVVPGGVAGSETIRDCAAAIALLRAQQAAGRWIGAMCAAPALVFAAHGLLGAAQVTCHPTFWAQLPAAQLSSLPVVRDDTHHLITAQGAGCAVAFALALVAALGGDALAAAVAAPMGVA